MKKDNALEIKVLYLNFPGNDHDVKYPVSFKDCSSGKVSAQRQEDACREMARRGFRLTHVVPVQSSQYSWLRGQLACTTGAWLYFRICNKEDEK